MGIIARPSGGFIQGNVANATDVNPDLDTIYAEFNGNIDASNIKIGAGITGSRCASKPNGMDSTNINAKAVTSVELANDGANDALRAVGTDHIKIASVTSPKLKISSIDWTPGGSLADNGVNSNILFTTAQGYPLEACWVKNGVPGGEAALQLAIVLNTATNTYSVEIGNTTGGTVSLAGLTARVYYIQAS